MPRAVESANLNSRIVPIRFPTASVAVESLQRLTLIGSARGSQRYGPVPSAGGTPHCVPPAPLVSERDNSATGTRPDCNGYLSSQRQLFGIRDFTNPDPCPASASRALTENRAASVGALSRNVIHPDSHPCRNEVRVVTGSRVSRGLVTIAPFLRRRVLAELLVFAVMALPAAVSAEEPLDFDVGAAGNTAPRGMWGNSEVLWVTDYLDSKLYAYAMADGRRLASRDIETRVGDTREGARYPTDVWSNGQIAWVTDNEFDRIYAYRLSDGGRVPDRDLSLSAANSQRTGLWGDGEKLWVTDAGNGKVYAYTLSDGSRLPASDFELAAPGGGTLARAWGLWSDGEMFRVVDFLDRRVYAYRGGVRAPEGDIENLRRLNQRPTGLWSDGRVLWVSDYGSAKLYAYNLASQALATPLTAEFVGVPESHDGQTAFRFTLQFSEPVSLSNQALRTTVLDVTEGVVRGTRRVTPGVHLSWWVPIQPASEADVVVVLPVTRDCASDGAVCTADGKPLSNSLEAVIAGPSHPKASITTATSPVTEGAPATFEVTLDEAASGSLTVQVDVTEDGSVLSGTSPASVTFNMGDTSATLSVPTEGDSVVEADTTVTAAVMPGTGYKVGSSATATATVEGRRRGDVHGVGGAKDDRRGGDRDIDCGDLQRGDVRGGPDDRAGGFGHGFRGGLHAVAGSADAGGREPFGDGRRDSHARRGGGAGRDPDGRGVACGRIDRVGDADDRVGPAGRDAKRAEPRGHRHRDLRQRHDGLHGIRAPRHVEHDGDGNGEPCRLGRDDRSGGRGEPGGRREHDHDHGHGKGRGDDEDLHRDGDQGEPAGGVDRSG